MKMISTVWIIMLLFACTPHHQQKLSEADRLMETSPDSALSILQIINPDSLGRADQAFYALLYTQALDKNEQDIPSDSLIQVAINYYSGRSNSPELAESWYYLGCYYVTAGIIEQAVKAFLDAEKVALDVNDYNLLGLINIKLGRLYGAQHIIPKALEFYTLSIHYFKKAGNSKNETKAMLGKGGTFLYTRQYDSVTYYLNMVKNRALSQQDTLLYTTALNLEGAIYLQQGYVEQAKRSIRQSIRLMLPQVPSSYYATLANIHYTENHLDSARHCINLALENNHDRKSIAALFYWLYKIEERAGNDKAAFCHFKRLSFLTDSINRDDQNQSVLFFSQKYNYELEKNKVAKLQIRNGRILFLAALLIITGGAIFWRNQYVLAKHKAKIRIFNHLLTSLENQDERLKEKGQQQLSLIRELLMEPTDAPGQYYKNMLVKHLAIGNSDKLQELINLLYDGLVDYMKQTYPQLKEAELQLCYLASVGFSTKEIAMVLKKNVSTIDNWRHTITLKLFPDKNVRFSHFIKEVTEEVQNRRQKNTR